MSVCSSLVPTYQQMLRALGGWLRKAQDDIADADTLLAARLAPDMFPLSTQIRFACLQAYEGVHRLRHEPLPPVADDLLTEGRLGGDQPGTIADALARIADTCSFLADIDPLSLDGAATRPLVLELPMGLTFDLDGAGYARDWALPQFYFHLSMAYAILRHRGVAIGKADFVPHMFAFLRQGPAAV